MEKVQLKLMLAVFALALFAGVSFAQKPTPTPAPTPKPAAPGAKDTWPNFPSMAQVIDKPDIRTLKLNSKLMGREMLYRVIAPRDYEYMKETRYPVVYLLHGLSGHYDNWTDKTRVATYVQGSNVIIVTPEGGDGWYSDSVTVANDKYESYIVQELIPEIDKTFRTKPDRAHRVIAGLSMGGYGAIKFGMKYPEMFSMVGSFSGAVDAPTRPSESYKALRNVFGADDSQSRKDNDVFLLAKNTPLEKIKDLPFIYFSCGTEDALVTKNRDLLNVLVEKKIPHEYRELPGVHNWAFWDAQIEDFVRISVRYFKD